MALNNKYKPNTQKQYPTYDSQTYWGYENFLSKYDLEYNKPEPDVKRFKPKEYYRDFSDDDYKIPYREKPTKNQYKTEYNETTPEQDYWIDSKGNKRCRVRKY
ncbi:MAG: hypothetical protein LBR15_03805 [Methanobrevibacter sp.]|jgi:hypothetical protein|nr:hypothetical protein [Candidatus Methanovirga australis]